MKSDLLNHGITSKPLRVLGHGNCRGIDLDRYNPEDSAVMDAAARLRKSGVFTFIFIGRIVRDKGMDELAGAFGRLYQKRRDVRLVLVGPYEDSLDPISTGARRVIDCPGIEAVGPRGRRASLAGGRRRPSVPLLP